MDINDIRNDLKKNCIIMHDTFQNTGLKCEKVGFGAFGEDGCNFSAFIEVSGNISKSVRIVVNCYDYNEELIFSGNCTIYHKDFMGYDTIEMYLEDIDLLVKTVKTKIFATY